MLNIINIKKSRYITRRGFLSLSGKMSIAATLPTFMGKGAEAAYAHQQNTPSDEQHPSWISDARIGDLTVHNGLDENELNRKLSLLVKQGVSAVKVDSGLVYYLSKHRFKQEIQRIKDITETIHSYGLKVVWYTPAFKVITTNGVYQLDSFARKHTDWLQVSFDGKEQGVFYGKTALQTGENDETAWLCPCSPYRQWIKKKLQKLAKTGVDGLWLDVFGQGHVKFPCSCHHCQKKFVSQTGLSFPIKYDLADPSFWKYVSWRHKIITRFLSECRTVVEKASSSSTQVIAEMSPLDYTETTYLGAEGKGLKNAMVAWDVKTISKATGMAEASYDEWLTLYNSYKCCRGATLDSPSWVLCYGYNKTDAQLVLASAVAAQNNPYALSVSNIDSSVEVDIRRTFFHWIKRYSPHIFQSDSIASVAIIYSERNRDFLDIKGQDDMPISSDNPDYLDDYQGLSHFFYQHQIPTDIYPFSRIDGELLNRYSVLVLPSMATISKDEKLILLGAVRNGVTLILTGTEQGEWDDRMTKRDHSLWDGILGESEEKELMIRYGLGKLFFWKEAVGRKYLKHRDEELTNKLLAIVNLAGVGRWLITKQPVVVQPYIYQQKMLIHLLNYSEVDELNNQPNRVNIELSIPWHGRQKPMNIIQTEPNWGEEKFLLFEEIDNKLIISFDIGINALVLIDLVQ